MASDKEIEDILKNPLSILAINDKQVLDKLNNLIPYSSAFEIECDMKPNVYNEENFEAIPNIISVDNSTYEQRYRIPNGIRGIICVYHISRQLKINSLLNPYSSIHYHVDCTEYGISMEAILQEDSTVKWILSELDTWLENESAARGRAYGCWYRYNYLETTEFRLGEMTFDYNVILKRIIHCNSMVRELKDKLKTRLGREVASPVFLPINKASILAYEKICLNSNSNWQVKALEKKLLEIAKKEEEELSESKEVPKEEIQPKTRVHKLF